MAVQYQRERGKPQKNRVIARWQSYHGNTLGASVGRRQPLAARAVRVAADRRCTSTSATPTATQRPGQPRGLRPAHGRRARSRDPAPRRRAGRGVHRRAVVGATIGAVPPRSRVIFRRIREICDRHDVLLILDEVMCGMGRTGTLHASEQEGVAPDIEIVAKGLGAGYQPIGAVLVHGTSSTAIRGGSGFFQHGHTYLGHPVACAAALAVQRVIRDEQLLPGWSSVATQPLLRQRLGPAPQRRRHPRPRAVPRRSSWWPIAPASAACRRSRSPCARQGRCAGQRPAVLSLGRHGRRAAGRRRAARAACSTSRPAQVEELRGQAGAQRRDGVAAVRIAA